ncbi:unnamed protein product [Urochloa humidicola]
MIKIQHYKNNNSTPQSYPRAGFNRYKKYTSQKKGCHSGQLHRRLGPLAAGPRQLANAPRLWDAWSPPARDARPRRSRAGRLDWDARPAVRAATAA